MPKNKKELKLKQKKTGNQFEVKFYKTSIKKF